MVLICGQLTLTPAIPNSVRGRLGSERRAKRAKRGDGGKKDRMLCAFSPRKKVDWHLCAYIYIHVYYIKQNKSIL